MSSFGKNIQAVYVADIYTPNTSGLVVAQKEKVNAKTETLVVDNKFRLLNVKVVLEDGTEVSKKILR